VKGNFSLILNHNIFKWQVSEIETANFNGWLFKTRPETDQTNRSCFRDDFPKAHSSKGDNQRKTTEDSTPTTRSKDDSPPGFRINVARRRHTTKTTPGIQMLQRKMRKVQSKCAARCVFSMSVERCRT
jgi:hypothetical protein